MTILGALAILGTGFSIVSALILLIAYWFYLPQMEKTLRSRLACSAVLLGLMLLQYQHFGVFVSGDSVLYTRFYVSLLMWLPLSFYLFSLYVLFAEEEASWRLLLHGTPILVSLYLEPKFVPPIAFTVGAAYTVWLAARLYTLRGQRARFSFEIFFFAMFSAMALLALMLGLALPLLNAQIFFLLYSLSISLAMISVVTALLIFPELMEDVVAITGAAYADSKLAGVDSEAALARLNHLMLEEKIYEDESLSLATVAELLQLSPHQLSELINKRCAQNFPSFVKSHRVAAAKTLLVEEPEASVLAISMQTGFKSQSAFYAAFKADAGESPGAYRKKHLGAVVS